ncbi:MAG: hypothetical protein QGG90_13080, partial [Nitrospinota bacterium]|nr:hypothetical protein [Nitrospinota bacterium]
ASAWHIAPIYSVRSGFRGLGLLLKERGAKEAGILNGSSLAKSYLPVYGLGARGLTAARIPNYPGDYLVLLSRSSFLDAGPGGLNPSALRTCLARAGVRPAWKGQHITVYAAMDLAKRPYTPVLNGLMQKVLGREVRRRAREILLITVEDGRRLVEQFKKTNGKECRFLEGTERGLLREWPGVHAWREEFP